MVWSARCLFRTIPCVGQFNTMKISILFLVILVAVFKAGPGQGNSSGITLGKIKNKSSISAQGFNNGNFPGRGPRPQYNGRGGYGYIMYYELCPWCTCPFCVGAAPGVGTTPVTRSTTTTEFQRQEESTTTETVTDTTTIAPDTTTETTAADTETITTEDPTTTTMTVTETTTTQTDTEAPTEVPTEAPAVDVPTTPRRVPTTRGPNVPNFSCLPCQWANRIPNWLPVAPPALPPFPCIFCGGSLSAGFFGRRNQFKFQGLFGGEGRNGFYRNGFRMGGRWTDSPYYSGRHFGRPQVEIFMQSRRSFNQPVFQNRFLFG